MLFLKASTAASIALGPFVSDSDGFSPETGLTIAQADVRLKKGGAAWAQKNEASSATHEENGWYEVALDTTDTNTVGPLVIAVAESGALPVWVPATVLPANVYDSLVGGTDVLQSDLTQIAGAAVSASSAQLGVNVVQVSVDAAAADNLEAAADGTGYNLGGGDVVVASVTDAVTLTLTQALSTAQTGDTVGGALLAARAQGFGKWVLAGTLLSLYAADGSTLVRQFTLDSAASPSSRT